MFKEVKYKSQIQFSISVSTKGISTANHNPNKLNEEVTVITESELLQSLSATCILYTHTRARF